MIFWYVVVIAVGLWALFIKLGYLLPPDAVVIVRIREGKPRVTRGRLRAQTIEYISDVFQQAGITRGFVAVAWSRRVMFSYNIPKKFRQRIRNILLNL
jgi:hypothetical protein